MNPSKFHAHLDVCAQCERQPFNLCPTGARLLREAAMGESVESKSPVITNQARTGREVRQNKPRNNP